MWVRFSIEDFPDSKIHGAYMGPIWGRQDPDGPHIDPMNFTAWVCISGDDTALNNTSIGK